jgi:hypothetical protein
MCKSGAATKYRIIPARPGALSARMHGTIAEWREKREGRG